MSANLRLLNFKASEEEIARWDAFARTTPHRNRSRWIRETLNEACLDASVSRASTVTTFTSPRAEQAIVVAEQLKERAAKVASVKSECFNRLPKGTFCNRCGRTH